MMPAAARGPALALIAGKFLAYAAGLLTLREFRIVGYEYATTLLLLLLLAFDLLWRREAARGFVVAGIFVSLVGGFAQTLRLAPHPHFNHNDVFHVVQMAALWLLFRGGLLLRDR